MKNNTKLYCNIVVIDSGYNDDKENLGISLVPNLNGVTQECHSFNDDVGHGTAVCGIIKAHNPNVRCFYIKNFKNLYKLLKKAESQW